MLEIAKSQQIKLKGEIAEVFQRNGQSFVRISLTPGLIELTLEAVPDVQLGDGVEIDARMAIEKVEIL